MDGPEPDHARLDHTNDISRDIHNAQGYLLPRRWREPVTVVLCGILDPPINFFTLHLFFPCPKWRPPLDHFVHQTAKTKPVRAESILLIVYDLRGHVPHGPNPPPHSLTLRNLHRKTEIRNSEKSNAISISKTEINQNQQIEYHGFLQTVYHHMFIKVSATLLGNFMHHLTCILSMSTAPQIKTLKSN